MTFHTNIFKSYPLLISLALFLLSGCGNHEEVAQEPAIKTVRIETVSTGTSLSQRRFIGRVEAVSTIDLSFQVSGRLIKLPERQGVIIKKGQLIAELDKTDFALAVSQAKAQYQQAQLDVTRKRNLFKSGSLPKAMLDAAETTFKVQRVALDTAQRNLAYTRIIAPFDVMVTKRLLDNYTNVAANQPVIRVQEVSELRVHINVPENLMKLLGRISDFKAIAVFKEYPEQQFPLSYREHVTESNHIAQTYEVVFGLPRQDNLMILPGMNVTVIIRPAFEMTNSEVLIPISALDYDAEGKPRVWVFNPDTKTVSSRATSIGDMQKDHIPVLAGLEQGEQIVTAGAQFLREGMRVQPFTAL